jgi:hypothetical protein
MKQLLPENFVRILTFKELRSLSEDFREREAASLGVPASFDSYNKEMRPQVELFATGNWMQQIKNKIKLHLSPFLLATYGL